MCIPSNLYKLSRPLTTTLLLSSTSKTAAPLPPRFSTPSMIIMYITTMNQTSTKQNLPHFPQVHEGQYASRASLPLRASPRVLLLEPPLPLPSVLSGFSGDARETRGQYEHGKCCTNAGSATSSDCRLSQCCVLFNRGGVLIDLPSPR